MAFSSLTRLAVRTLELLNRRTQGPFATSKSTGTVIIINIGGDYIGRDKRTSENHNLRVNGISVTNRVTQRLDNCLNTIRQHPDGKQKRLLEELENEVRQLVRALPADKQEEASGHLELAVKAVKNAKPNRAWYSISAEGLLEASQYVREFTENIARILQNLGKAIWPDFLLPPH